jgi:hypothetical protein
VGLKLALIPFKKLIADSVTFLVVVVARLPCPALVLAGAQSLPALLSHLNDSLIVGLFTEAYKVGVGAAKGTGITAGMGTAWGLLALITPGSTLAC